MHHYRFAVLGDPVEHSRSPQIHSEMLAMTGLDGEYRRVRADRGVLETTVGELRTGDWDGLNVTMPLKVDAAELSDVLEDGAALSGSVNTIVMRSGRVAGYSTDTLAFATLFATQEAAAATSLLILGAGGSAAAALAALAGQEAFVSSRDMARAKALCDRLGGTPIAWGSAVEGALVVNATPIGMKGEALPGGVLGEASGLIDLPYGDVSTPAMDLANRIGLPCWDGHEFLVRQAVDSFHLWTGANVDVGELMRRLRNT